MTTLSAIEQEILAFNKDADAMKQRRDHLAELAIDAGLSRRHVAKALATVTVRMPAGE